ncbi:MULTISPECIES: BRO-N domain-containing protein [Pasteurellaceae]|uniref:BRO family protein n=1 Tax=Pasteurella atlantica TaxID=2827233 RepID=A0AAW8CPJ4_9PAST|nr:BRO family protein [Pasteurella atlantica]MBR0574172.1 hypothetical protein [Pasteurella atlantica]MDP8039281.1 BRO family protein [Pasteurella atlantica]MDP8041373.1 BRO family protein [Pasteurella atlantica]MDP8043509.1 BRO family protein [Pasteurella atlantica]MDP8045573.1 BRO family protein [Pasteurella atlantica]
MSNVTQFNFKSNQVRVEIKDDQPLFCLKDVASILEISNSKASRFKLKAKGIHKMYLLTSGGKQQVVFIDEPNLYRVIFRSNKKEAIEFQDWVFEEVLPTIRKTGNYSIQQPKSHTQTKPINIPKKLNVGGVIVHPIKINGQAYFTARELACAFGYTKSDAILRKYREYKRLFKEGMVQTAQHYVTNLVGKRTLTLSYAFNIDALRLIEAQMNPKARRNTFRLGLARLERALENPQLNLPIQQPDLPVQISPTVIEKPIGLNPGRWFVNVDDNCNITTLMNLEGKSIVEAELYDQLKGETRMMAKLMQELAERMKIASGECSPSRFDIPLLQPKNL